MRSPIRRRVSRVLFKFHFTNCTTQAHVRVHTLAVQRRTCSAPNTCIPDNKRQARALDPQSVGGRKSSEGKPGGNTGSRAHKPSRRLWSFFPFMRFIRSCHFLCLHPRAVAHRCACARADLASSLREEGTVRYVWRRPGGIS